MGVSYLVFALTPETADLLRNAGQNVSSPLPESRLPRLRELRSIVSGLEDFTYRTHLSATRVKSVNFVIVHTGGYDAGWSTDIWASHAKDRTLQAGDDDQIAPYFHKGHPELAVLILERLSRICGPLVLVRDMDGKPVLISPGADPRQTFDAWLND